MDVFDNSEKRFEQDIESFLISEKGGYEQFSYLNPDGHRIHKYVYDKDKIIDKEDVASFILLDEYDPCSFAVGCVDLYGPEAFCNFKNRYTMNKDEVFDFLKKFSYDPETTVICD